MVEWLSEKDDALRYQAFLLLKYRSQYSEDVYPFWDVFHHKLASDNSYQRSIGLMLLADNVRWDKDNRIDSAVEDYLQILHDEKPITVRQCIQSLEILLNYKPHLQEIITDRLIEINLLEIKETMRKLVLMDILNVLIISSKKKASCAIENYITLALTGEILDKKARKQIEAML